jgi:non-ribosomal peptide synthetase component F
MTIERALAGEFAHVFNLADGQPLRASLTELAQASSGATRTLLTINIHHIAADGWSVAIIMANLAAFYQARADGGSALKPLERQYKDFAYWQSSAFALLADHPALAFWRKRLINGALETAIPTDFQRPTSRAGRGAMTRHVLDAAASGDLRRAATAAGTTLFATFSALLHALLHLRSGAAATMIGAADAGRDLLEVEDQVGFYLNLMAFRLSVDPAAPLSSWIAAATAEAAAVFEHKAYPFDLVLEKLELSAAPGHSPVFDILLLLQNNATPTGRFADLEIEILADRTVSSKYDLNLMVEDRSEIELVLEYDSDLYRAETAGWFLDDLVRLIGAVSDGRDRAPVEILQSAIVDEGAANDVGLLDDSDPLFGPA